VYSFHFPVFKSQTLDIVDMAIRPVVCQKSDLHGSSDFQNSQKLDPSQTTTKKIWAKIYQPFKDNLVQKVDSWYITNVE
jgi:hypothetical protein